MKHSHAIRRLGMLGGAFAPIHNGHLRLARAAQQQFGLERVHLVPTAVPVHRKSPLIAFDRRAQWVQLATREDSGLLLDRREQQRGGASYSLTTVLELREEFPAARLHLILGVDAFADFLDWHQWQAIAASCVILVGSRPGYPPAAETAAGRAVARCAAADDESLGWRAFDAGTEDVSSSAIRQRLKCGQDIAGMLPDAVLADITTEELKTMGLNE